MCVCASLVCYFSLYAVGGISGSLAEKGLDMGRMKDIVEKRLEKVLNAMETSPHSSLSDTLIWYFLYGEGKVCMGESE